MAKWIYNRPYELCSEGERIVAKALGKLSDSWTIRWGFYYHTDREGDFLILGPSGGLLVLEVKGGQLRQLTSTGNWEGPERDHPFVQLLGEWKGVLVHLESVANGRKLPFVAKALCLTELTIATDTKEFRGIDRSQILDRRDLADFVNVWHQRLFPNSPAILPESRQLFLEAYAASIDPKNVRCFVNGSDRILLQHLQSDFQILEMLEGNRQLFIEGGPGTGKTWLAIEHAHHLAENNQGEDGRRVLLLCYNLALAELLTQLVAKRRPNRGEIVVRSWESLAKGLFEQVGVEWNPPAEGPDRYRYFTLEVPSLMWTIVNEPDFSATFDALVVDEAQDHDTQTAGDLGMAGDVGWWEIYWKLLRSGSESRITLAFDVAQRPIYRGSTAFDPDKLRAQLPHAVHLRLKYTRRYTRPILEFLQTLASPSTHKIVKSLYSDKLLPEGPDVEMHNVRTHEMIDAVRKVAKAWIQGGFCKPEDILILTPRTKSKTSLSGVSRIGDWPLEEALERTPGTLGMLSIHRAKGLDALGVILVDFQHREDLEEAQQAMDFFMAASRARQLLAVVTADDRE
jgi:hypothetical protein